MKNTTRTKAAVGVLIIWFASLGGSYALSTHNDNEQRAAAARQGAVIEQKLCTTFEGIGSLKPPAGNPGKNPSRAYDQKLHAKLAQIVTDLRCP